MTLILSQSDWESLQLQSCKPSSDCPEEFESIWVYPDELGDGYCQDIQLQEWLELSIARYRLHQDTTSSFPEHQHPVQAGFCLSGRYQYREDTVSAGQSYFCGSGLAQGGVKKQYAQQPLTTVNIHIAPEQFRNSIGNSVGEIHPLLNHLFRSNEQIHYVRFSRMTAAMQSVLQQILGCPYHGITKRLYLESKALELLALSVEQELHIQTNGLSHDRAAKPLTFNLKPDDVDRIQFARDVLQQRLDNPPSLIELARAVGLNDCTLKRGFRQIFGTTVFGYLYDCRMDRARQMLQERRMTITEIARTVGYANHRSFAAAFKKKYGINPKRYAG